jgi:FkbM family methyltransferase
MSLPEIHLATDGDLNYALFKHNDIVSNAVRSGGYETELHGLVKMLLGDSKPGIVLDIGANLGSFTIPLAKEMPNHSFMAFEPQRIIYYQLCTNVFLNRLDNVYPYQWALSNGDWRESMDMPDYEKETNIGAFSVDPEVRNKEYEVKTKGEFAVVCATMLDNFKFEDIKLIKIDVEGHELEVLQGAHKTLELNNYPPIIFESWTWKFPEKRAALFGYLTDIGYTITEYGQNNLAEKK